MTITFITRNNKGVLQQDLANWDMFKSDLFSMAKDVTELQFLGQLVEDLQYAYEEKVEEMEEAE